MTKNKDNIVLTAEECRQVLNNFNTRCILTDEDKTEENLDIELKQLFLAREVALFIKSSGFTLEENSFYSVSFLYENKTILISIGNIKTERNTPTKLTYGVLHK